MSSYKTCKGCGQGFSIPGTVGRPPAYCAQCRASRRSDDAGWRTIRAKVLAEEPVCAVVGCGRPSTTVDHVIPLVRGGPRLDRANLRGMCAHHNFSKGAKLPLVSPLVAQQPKPRQRQRKLDVYRCDDCDWTPTDGPINCPSGRWWHM